MTCWLHHSWRRARIAWIDLFLTQLKLQQIRIKLWFDSSFISRKSPSSPCIYIPTCICRLPQLVISVIQKPDDDHISHLASPKDLQILTWYILELWWPRASKYVLSCRYFAAFALAQPSLHWLNKLRWSANVRSLFLAAEVSLTSLKYFSISIAATRVISLLSRWFQNRPRDVFDAYVCVQPLSLFSLDTRLWNRPSREPVPSSACFWHHTILLLSGCHHSP